MITEETLYQTIIGHAMEKYSDRIEDLDRRFREEFPEHDLDISDELWARNYLCWLVFEKVVPETGKTMAEEIAEAFEDMEPEMKRNILQIKNVIRSNFAVIAKKGLVLTIKDMKTQAPYTVVVPNGLSYMRPNMLLIGRIHPFGDHHRFLGVVSVSTTPLILAPEILMHQYEAGQVDRYDSIQLRKGSTFQSVMNKFPAHWIDWMCTHYRIKERLKKDKIRIIKSKLIAEIDTIIDELSGPSKDILRICLSQGGFVKYGKLKDFDDEMGFFWDERNWNSPVAELRQKGLLFVGKMKIGNRKYRIAFVPNELREGMAAALSSRIVQTTIG